MAPIPRAAAATDSVQLLNGSVVATGLVDAGSLKSAGSTTTGSLSASGSVSAGGNVTGNGNVLAGSGKKIGFKDPQGTSGSNFEEVDPGVRVRLNGVVFPDNLAVLLVHELEFNVADYKGTQVTKSGGGAGLFEVASVTNVDVDNNKHICPDGGVMIGFQFVERPTNQISFDLICTD